MRAAFTTRVNAGFASAEDIFQHVVIDTVKALAITMTNCTNIDTPLLKSRTANPAVESK
jgi:hypothetical protein